MGDRQFYYTVTSAAGSPVWVTPHECVTFWLRVEAGGTFLECADPACRKIQEPVGP